MKTLALMLLLLLVPTSAWGQYTCTTPSGTCSSSHRGPCCCENLGACGTASAIDVAVPKPTCECCVHRRGCPIPRVAQWLKPAPRDGQGLCTCHTIAGTCRAWSAGNCTCQFGTRSVAGVAYCN